MTAVTALIRGVTAFPSAIADIIGMPERRTTLMRGDAPMGMVDVRRPELSKADEESEDDDEEEEEEEEEDEEEEEMPMSTSSPIMLCLPRRVDRMEMAEPLLPRADDEEEDEERDTEEEEGETAEEDDDDDGEDEEEEDEDMVVDIVVDIVAPPVSLTRGE